MSYTHKPTKLCLPTSRYDERRADYAVDFISHLRHTTGEWHGKPFVLMPWQEQIVRDIFGVVDKETGYRQFRTAYVEVGKKNGKSELAAAIALYLLFADGEAGAEVYSCAADINQASIVFNTARAMVEQWSDLSQISKLVPSVKKIQFPHTNSFYRVLSSETKSKQGFNVSGLIFDELFAQQTRELFDTMTKYTGDARRQPLYFLITTAGRDKTSICYEIHCKAKAVLDGSKIDPSFYPAVFGIEEDDNWEDEKIWRRVNPSIGVTIYICPMVSVRFCLAASSAMAVMSPSSAVAFSKASSALSPRPTNSFTRSRRFTVISSLKSRKLAVSS
jgi:phage terminase large subunit-like protein